MPNPSYDVAKPSDYDSSNGGASPAKTYKKPGVKKFPTASINPSGSKVGGQTRIKGGTN